MFKIKYSEDKAIFYVELIGNINHIQIINYIDVICNTKVNSRNVIIITDFTKATIDELTVDPIGKIGFIINTKLKKLFEDIKWAILSNSPAPTAGTLILHELITDSKLEMQPFSTIGGIINWSRIEMKDIDNLIFLCEDK